MTTEEKIALFEHSRERMHKVIDERYDAMIECIRNGESIRNDCTEKFELGNPSFIFKGKKPVSIVYPNGEKVAVKSWIQVAEELLRDCNKDPQRHEALMKLRYTVGGRNRWLLADSANSMNVPIKVDDDIYFEGKFDTEYLLKMLKEKIFAIVDYPYESIELEVREKGMVATHIQSVTESQEIGMGEMTFE